MRFRFVSIVLHASFLALALSIGSAANAESERKVYPNAESVEPRAVGTTLPSADLRNLDGEAVDLAKLVSESGALLVFYRGGW